MAQKDQVRDMFNSIAPKYDLLNHVLSAGIDILWRKKVIHIIKKYKHQTILDVATGTGDLAIAAAKLNPEKIVGIDISGEMLKFQAIKLKKNNLENLIELKQGDGESLPFSDNTFDVAMVAFGVRNFENLQQGLAEMYRVLKKGSIVVILEFSKPQSFPVKQLYNFYFKNILPTVGKWISRSKHAYNYLPESVGYFPSGNDFAAYLKDAGFSKTNIKTLTFGIASIYTGEK
ncbi:MAG: bifunctional demethylmenaquinone methyltransferase/2-methoxy-6-polyprenyl-1,4-benzoquinol methylase UbiE [Bacteroidales bacterium]|nr:bifunctional demethylmenaquinone methyltransferase/2-methoxy-6-polyprenyl-1,4-benzoquinol methylase UbiE [Bacteroidales bacterium]